MQKELLNEDFERCSQIETNYIQTEIEYEWDTIWLKEQFNMNSPKIEIRYKKNDKVREIH